jgi:hypothetical protein
LIRSCYYRLGMAGRGVLSHSGWQSRHPVMIFGSRCSARSPQVDPVNPRSSGVVQRRAEPRVPTGIRHSGGTAGRLPAQMSAIKPSCASDLRNSGPRLLSAPGSPFVRRLLCDLRSLRVAAFLAGPDHSSRRHPTCPTSRLAFVCRQESRASAELHAGYQQGHYRPRPHMPLIFGTPAWSWPIWWRKAAGSPALWGKDPSSCRVGLSRPPPYMCRRQGIASDAQLRRHATSGVRLLPASSRLRATFIYVILHIPGIGLIRMGWSWVLVIFAGLFDLAHLGASAANGSAKRGADQCGSGNPNNEQCQPREDFGENCEQAPHGCVSLVAPDGIDLPGQPRPAEHGRPGKRTPPAARPDTHHPPRRRPGLRPRGHRRERRG